MALTINTILSTLKQELEDYIDPTDSYTTKPVIKHGYFDLRELEGNMPCVCFMHYEDELMPSMSDYILAQHRIRVYGFAKNDGTGSHDAIKELAYDVLHFIFSDNFTYTGSFSIVSNVSFLEGGDNRPTDQFMFDLRIDDDNSQEDLRE